VARVLHIEDDPASRRLVRKLLTASGFEVVDAASGLEGVRLADEVSPDLVLVDINIPDLDGYEVILRLRGTPNVAGVPIEAITAEGDRQQSLAVGADGFSGKPIDASKFPKTVSRFLGGHREELADEGALHLRQRSQRIVERLERKVVELEEANRTLSEMARLRQEFLQNVSHELATPMTPVVGYLRLLLGEELGPLTPLQRKCLDSVQASTQRLRGVVDTLLDVSSLESGQMHFFKRPYELDRVARRAVDEVRPSFADAGVSLSFEPGDEALPAEGDPDKLRRAMIHVLDNAAKFTPRGGEVAVAVERGAEGNDSISLLVADSGPGVRREEVDKILEPFYQVDGSVTRSHGGVGLGLAFARRVSEALGGSLAVVSPPDREVAGRRLEGTLVRLQVARDPAMGSRG